MSFITRDRKPAKRNEWHSAETTNDATDLITDDKPAVHEAQTSATGRAILSAHLQTWPLPTPVTTCISMQCTAAQQ